MRQPYRHRQGRVGFVLQDTPPSCRLQVIPPCLVNTEKLQPPCRLRGGHRFFDSHAPILPGVALWSWSVPYVRTSDSIRLYEAVNQ